MTLLLSNFICQEPYPDKPQANPRFSKEQSINPQTSSKLLYHTSFITPVNMPSTVSNDASTIIPLLFAAHPTLVPDYRRMAAMDDIGRTQAALEHKFRTWRQDGKKIAAAKGDTEGMKSVTKKAVSTTKVAGEKKAPRTVLSRSLKTAKEVEDESGETGDDADEAQPNAKVGSLFSISLICLMS